MIKKEDGTGYNLEKSDHLIYLDLRAEVHRALNDLIHQYMEDNNVLPSAGNTIIANLALEYASFTACLNKRVFIGGEPDADKWSERSSYHFKNAVKDTEHLKDLGSVEFWSEKISDASQENGTFDEEYFLEQTYNYFKNLEEKDGEIND